MSGRHGGVDPRWLEAVLDTLREAVMVFDRDGRVEWCNARAAAALGMRPEELLGRRIGSGPFEVVDAAGTPIPRSELPAAVCLREERPVVGHRCGVVHAGGSTIWLEVDCYPLQRDGETVGVVASMVDITARVAAERELAQRRVFEDLITRLSSEFVALDPGEVDDAIDDGLAEVGTALDADRAYVFLRDPTSGVFDEHFEWTAPGIRGFLDVRRGVDRRTMPVLLDHLERLEAFVVEDVSALPPEARREQRIFASQDIQAVLCVPMVSGTELTGFIGIDSVRSARAWSEDTIRLLRVIGEIFSHSIRRQRDAERTADVLRRLRRANEELEALNRELLRATAAKDEFLSIASHELRGPIGTILGFVETLERRGTALGEDQQRIYLAAIRRQAERLIHLVEDLLESSRLDVGAVRVEPQTEPAGALIQRILAESGIEDVAVSGAVGTPVHADPEHVRRILVNLISNARKYGAPPVEITVGTEDQFVTIAVRDHGPGVPEEFRPHLFERFTRARHGRDVEGTGLGLAIVRDLAVLNGGGVRYEPADPGARFVVSLPKG